MNSESNTEEVKNPLGNLRMVGDETSNKRKMFSETKKEESKEQEQEQQTTNTEENEKIVQQEQEQDEGKQLQEQDKGAAQEKEINDELVLQYLKDKKGLEIDNFESLTKQEQKELDVPEDVKKYLEYKKETNRSYQDYLELQKDWKSEDKTKVLETYLKEKNPYFDEQDIKDEMSEFSYDESLDDEDEVKKKKRKEKKLLSEAISYLESKKEKYKSPIEGSSQSESIPSDYKEAKAKLDEISRSQEQQQELIQQRTNDFVKKTKELFTDDFEGFKYSIGDKEFSFKADKDSKNIAESQSDINNFISKFTDEQGNLVDIKGYHKALNAAMNVDKLASHFYEQGKTDAIKSDAMDSKNINFSGRKAPDFSKAKKGLRVVGESTQKFGFKQKK